MATLSGVWPKTSMWLTSAPLPAKYSMTSVKPW
jgi:hypothetical protein